MGASKALRLAEEMCVVSGGGKLRQFERVDFKMEDNLCTSLNTGMLDVHRAECQPQNVDGEWWVDDAIMPIP
jgi:hypothetical protein